METSLPLMDQLAIDRYRALSEAFYEAVAADDWPSVNQALIKRSQWIVEYPHLAGNIPAELRAREAEVMASIKANMDGIQAKLVTLKRAKAQAQKYKTKPAQTRLPRGYA